MLKLYPDPSRLCEEENVNKRSMISCSCSRAAKTHFGIANVCDYVKKRNVNRKTV
jgi:hypothetical protein